MVLQMTQIGEESGSLDNMLGKVADFYEREVDDAVAALSSLLEPVIIVFLGVVIGGLVIAMYLPIFKLGAVDLIRAAGSAIAMAPIAAMPAPAGPGTAMLTGASAPVAVDRRGRRRARRAVRRQFPQRRHPPAAEDARARLGSAVRRDSAARRPRQSPRYNLVVPRSACPACGHRIGALREHPGRLVARAARASARPAARPSRRAIRWSRSCGASLALRRAVALRRRRGRAPPPACSSGRCSRSRSSTSTRSTCPTT